MGGGSTELHIDNDHLATGTHDRADGVTTLHAAGAHFKSCGVRVGLYIENVDSGENSTVASVTEEEITTADDLSWDNGQTYKIYKTATKNSLISTQWIDVSRGWKTPRKDLKEGWRPEDRDIDKKKPGRVFGPGQPEKSHG